MKVTAETITHEQIRELRDACVAKFERGVDARVMHATDGLRAMRSWISQRKGTSDGLMPHQVQALVDHIATEIANLERSAP